MQVARYVAGLAKNETIAVLNLSKSALYTMSHGDYHARLHSRDLAGSRQAVSHAS